jgi:hypothetical protein
MRSAPNETSDLKITLRTYLPFDLSKNSGTS